MLNIYSAEKLIGKKEVVKKEKSPSKGIKHTIVTSIALDEKQKTKKKRRSHLQFEWKIKLKPFCNFGMVRSDL